MWRGFFCLCRGEGLPGPCSPRMRQIIGVDALFRFPLQSTFGRQPPRGAIALDHRCAFSESILILRTVSDSSTNGYPQASARACVFPLRGNCTGKVRSAISGHASYVVSYRSEKYLAPTIICILRVVSHPCTTSPAGKNPQGHSRGLRRTKCNEVRRIPRIKPPFFYIAKAIAPKTGGWARSALRVEKSVYPPLGSTSYQFTCALHTQSWKRYN